MTLDQFLALLLAGGVGAIGKALVDAYQARSAARRDDRRQKSDETKTQAESSLTLIESAERIVKLQNEQIDDLKRIITEQQQAFQKRLDAQAAALSAYETRLDREMEMRRKSDLIAEDLRGQLSKLRDELANVKAEFKLVDQNAMVLHEENQAMKTKLFEMALGVAALVHQITEAGLVPAYMLDVPVIDFKPRTGPLGKIDVEAVKGLH